MMEQGVFLCIRTALTTLSVSREPVCDVLPLISLLACLTASSALLLALGLYAVDTLWTMPHLEQKFSKVEDVNTLAPSVVNVRGIPNVMMNFLKVLTVLALVSVLNWNSVSQLLYLSTKTR